MCENIQYWMRLYVARVIKGGLIAVVASFLLFECSDESSKMGNPDNPDNPNNPNNPDQSVIGKVILSENALAFYDILGGRGVEYTISLSEDSALVKAVRVTITSDNDALQISPAVVTFTKTTGRGPQAIIVKGKADANGVFNKIPADITGLIDHTITSNIDRDPTIITFQDGSTVNVTVWSTEIADPDGDGLIEIYTAEMLQNMRHDRAGASYKTSDGEDVVGDSSGCPPVVNGSGGCKGYELIDDIDLKGLLDRGGGDADEANGIIDTKLICIDTDADATDDCVNADDDDDDDDKQVRVIDTGTGKDTSWEPIGDSTTKFTGTFEGNGHTIANLWVNGAFIYAGLFGFTDENC